MRVLESLLFLGALALACGSAGAATSVRESDVVWNSPSEDSSGSMPLGNGDIGVNAWVEPSGDLLFYVSKTDSWSEVCRLLKLGRVRISISPNPLPRGARFVQTLRLETGDMLVEYGAGKQACRIRLWVDANHPVVRVDVDSASKVEVRARLELWRDSERVISGAESGFGLSGSPVPLTESADTLAPSARGVCWYHRNASSVFPATLRTQDLGSLIGRIPDPLMGRSFGGLIEGDGMTPTAAGTIRSTKAGRRFSIRIHALTAQTSDARGWVDRIEAQAARVASVRSNDARRAHEEWWRRFWERSWIRVSRPQSTLKMKGNALPLRIGADSAGGNGFVGGIERVRFIHRSLTPDEIAALSHGDDSSLANDKSVVGDWRLNSTVETLRNAAGSGLPAKPHGERSGGDASGLRLDGRGWAEVQADDSLNMGDACTIDAWIRPDALPPCGGRIVDKCPVGVDEGFILDTYPGNSLRLITSLGTLTFDAKLAPGSRHHVAATFDGAAGTLRLYLDGEVVASRDFATAVSLSREYALQRYVTACAGRGAYPIKFNGSIFTVDDREPGESFNADYRRWGGAYWFQNTRLPYWPMLASGDFEMMLPLFRMYRDMLPLAVERTRIYSGHDGAFFPETLYPWGAYTNDCYGWDRTGKRPGDVANPFIRRYIQGGVELCAMMLDYYHHTGDGEFARETMLPIADEVAAYYANHYPRDADGRIVMKPAQSLETWWECVNPLPDIAGLRKILPELLDLPGGLTSAGERAKWRTLLADLPAIPTRVESDGVRLMGYGENMGPRGNIEDPELYAVFPYRLYAVGRPDLDVGVRSYEARAIKINEGWRQDPINAAYLGLAQEAGEMVIARFGAKHPRSRFPGFYGPNFDWVPDQDHASVAVMALQSMLLQADGKEIILFPAWPRDWDVDFKLHAPEQTTVEGVYRGGKLERLVVTPASRAKDVVNMLGAEVGD